MENVALSTLIFFPQRSESAEIPLTKKKKKMSPPKTHHFTISPTMDLLFTFNS